MSSFFDEIAAKLAQLSGVATPEVSRDELNEFNVRDIQAVTVSEGGSGGGGNVPFVGVDPPGSPTDGMLWWDPDDDTPSGSVPGAVRTLDLGVVNAVDLLNGSVVLYTPVAGEMVGPVLLTDVVFADTSSSVIVYGPGFDPNDPVESYLAIYDSDLGNDTFGISISNDTARLLFTDGVLKAALFGGGIPAEPWEAGTYDGSPILASVIGAGHVWNTSDSGDTGVSEPDWAGNFGGTVVDGDLTWSDNAAITQGSAHFYAEVRTPVAP